jgi:hypothetical protein
MTRRTRNYYVRRRQFSGGIGEAFRLAAIDFQLRAYSYAYSLFNYATKLKAHAKHIAAESLRMVKYGL